MWRHLFLVKQTMHFPYLTISHSLIVVSVCQQDVVQHLLQARLSMALEEDVVRKGPMHVCSKTILVTLDVQEKWTSVDWELLPTCMDGFLQLGVVLHGQQRLVITGFTLHLLLSAAGRHPDLCPVFTGNTFTHKSLHFPNRLFRVTHAFPKLQINNELTSLAPVRFFSTSGFCWRSRDHLIDLLLRTPTYWFIISL